MEGPRGLKYEELPSAVLLSNSIFRRNSPYKMEDEFPLLFSRGNLDNMRVFTDAGNVISLVGMSIKDAMIMGCRIRTVSIGAVCTHPEYRNRGLATRLMEDATKRARRKGVELMLVSGVRGLYRRLGCINAGIYRSFFVRREQLGQTDGGGLSLRRYEEGDMVDLIKLHQSEPIRFVRPLEDFSTLLAAKRLCDRLSETYVISKGGKVVAYVCIQLPRGEGKPLGMLEFAGPRSFIISKLRDLMDEVRAGSAIIEAPSADIDLESLLLAAGAKQSTRGFMGTVRLIDVKGFLECIDPYVTEIIGTGRRRDLTASYSHNPPELKFGYRGQGLRLSGIERITAFVFGSLEGGLEGVKPDEMKGSAPELGELLATLFPMPLVDYGLNYV